MRTFLTLLAMTSLIWTMTEGAGDLAQCARFGNGCSIPGDIYLPYKDLFTPSCNQHDVCYDCGAIFGLSRMNCDTRFRESMRNACANRSLLQRIIALRTCEDAANAYYWAVDQFGEENYSPAGSTMAYCSTSRTTVVSCLGV